MSKTLPMLPGPQVVPSPVCLQCDICCRFPERDSLLRPYFSADEIRQAIDRGLDPSAFSDPQGSQVEVVAHPSDEGFLCPAFDPVTHHCRIYEVRPLDCQLYPFAIMWDEQHETVLLGWDTLCPFRPVPATENLLFVEEPVTPLKVDLPAVLKEKSRRVIAYLESQDVLRSLAGHPQLVTPFQPGVIVLHRLERLTGILQSPDPSSSP